ncbi:mechanosensitive ion channel family protein [Tamlana sp. I1]|uniref:mechanosensitive ion channel family protein n=1 Tax=Tamlana sp. I1 TaxID=2762061 RepID=UPI00188DECD5|nr:mechanosensitive ion channel domain-containing protein [Tamlana sp. I1]
MNLKFFITSLLICLTCFFNPANLNAQEFKLDNTSTVVDSLKTKPKAIPLINIVQEIEKTNNDLKLKQRKIKRSTDIEKIDSLLPAYAAFLKLEGERAEHFIKANPNVQKINNTSLKWNGYLSYLRQWISEINNQEERNSILIEDIQFKAQVWKLSYDNAVAENVPLEVLAAIKGTVDEIEKTKKSIFDNNNYYIKLEAEISKEINYVEDILDELVALKNSDVYDLFYLRHPPIWKTSFEKTQKDLDEKSEIQSLKGTVANIHKMPDQQKGRIILFIIFVALIVITLKYFKSGFYKYPYEEKNERVVIFKNLIVNGNYLCIAFTSLTFAKMYFATAHKFIGDSITLLAILVAIPMIMPLMTKRFKNILYFVLLFYILNSAKTYLWFSSLGYRIYILIEALIVILILYHFTHPYLKTIKLFKGGFNAFLIRLTPVIYFLSAVSIISNILGYTNLTDITLKISTQGAIITILFYGISIIISGSVISVIHRHFTVKKTYSASERRKIEDHVLKIIRISMYFIWGLFFLGMIDLLRPLIDYFTDVFSEPYKIGSLTFTLGAVISFILTLILAFALTRLVTFLINDDDGVLRFLKLPKGIPAAVSLVVRYFIIGFGIILALSALGVDLSKFNLMAGALGLGIGFGLQTVISNFVSGLILVFERPILPGDTVEVNNLLGTVNRIGVRASKISTFDGAEVVVPNNSLVSNDLINWTLSNNTKRVEILIGTTYDSDPNEILKILKEVATNCPYVLKDPEPRALFNDFGDSSLNFRLLFWVHYELGLQAKSDVSIDIYNRFKAEGIEIPFPQRDLNIKNIPEGFDMKPPHELPLDVDDTSDLNKNVKRPLIEPLESDIDSDAGTSDDADDGPVK